MAGLAALREATVVGILVTIRTLIERDTNVLGLAIGAIDVALRALHLGVHTGQRVTRFRVIELTDFDDFQS